MSAIINASIRVDKLPKEKFVKGRDGAVFYNFSIVLQDETRYGNNVAIVDSQSKEQREAKMQKTYLGNGKVVWVSDGKIEVAEREDKPEYVNATKTHLTEPASDDLPF